MNNTDIILRLREVRDELNALIDQVSQPAYATESNGEMAEIKKRLEALETDRSWFQPIVSGRTLDKSKSPFDFYSEIGPGLTGVTPAWLSAAVDA